MNSSLRPNVGGIVSPSDLFGRDQFIDRMWDILNRNSVVLEAPRRMGKTSLLRKMSAEPPPGWEVIYLNLEDVQAVAEFASRVLDAVRDQIHRWDQRLKHFKEFERWQGNCDTTGPWKDLLIAVVDDLCHAQEASGRRALLIFDEMPMMLERIANSQGDQTAIEVLDLLRGIRQSNETKGVRMVFSGEVVFDQVLARLQPNSGRPLNDLHKMELGPLERADAVELATRLMNGLRLNGDRAAATRVADITGGIPFYIQSVVQELAEANVPATPAAVDQIVRAAITALSDPFQLRIFREHLRTYYHADEELVFAILDHLAAAEHPVSARKLFDLPNTSDEELVFEVLRRLTVDRVLNRDEEGRFFFQNPFLREWWAHERGPVSR